MNTDERIALLNKFLLQLRRTAAKSLGSIDMLKLGIPAKQEVARLLESFNQAVEISKEIGRFVATPDAEPTQTHEPIIPSEDEERVAIENAREVLSRTTEFTMGGVPSLRRLWTPFRNDAHADVVRQGGGDYLGTKDSRVWFLDGNGSSRTLRVNQLTQDAVRHKIATKTSHQP